MKNINDYTAEELRVLLKKRIVREEEEEALMKQEGLSKLKDFLSGKEYILFKPHDAYFEFYHLDKDFIPYVKDGKWVSCKPIAKLYISTSAMDSYNSQTNIVYEGINYTYEEFKYDNNNFEKYSRKDNLKYFYPENDMSKLFDISKKQYDDVVNTIRFNINNTFSKLDEIIKIHE